MFELLFSEPPVNPPSEKSPEEYLFEIYTDGKPPFNLGPPFCTDDEDEAKKHIEEYIDNCLGKLKEDKNKTIEILIYKNRIRGGLIK